MHGLRNPNDGEMIAWWDEENEVEITDVSVGGVPVPVEKIAIPDHSEESFNALVAEAAVAAPTIEVTPMQAQAQGAGIEVKARVYVDDPGAIRRTETGERIVEAANLRLDVPRPVVLEGIPAVRKALEDRMAAGEPSTSTMSIGDMTQLLKAAEDGEVRE